MNGRLTYRDARPEGVDPVNDPVDWVFDALAYVWERVSIELVVELLFGFLELL
jgi:hypothetical protein